jgi:signal transduction histidine kinase
MLRTRSSDQPYTHDDPLQPATQDVLPAVAATARASGAWVRIVDRKYRVLATGAGVSTSPPTASVASNKLIRSAIAGGSASLVSSRGQPVGTEPVREAGHIVGGDLKARAEVGAQLELASLADSFNTMADGLAANVQAKRDFAANAPHQLRTPLTAEPICLYELGHAQPGGNPCVTSRGNREWRAR